MLSSPFAGSLLVTLTVLQSARSGTGTGRARAQSTLGTLWAPIGTRAVPRATGKAPVIGGSVLALVLEATDKQLAAAGNTPHFLRGNGVIEFRRRLVRPQ